MTTAIHTTKFDAEQDAWLVLDPDGDEVDWAATEAEAREIAAELTREAKVNALREQVEELVGSCEDVARLEKALAALRGR